MRVVKTSDGYEIQGESGLYKIDLHLRAGKWFLFVHNGLPGYVGNFSGFVELKHSPLNYHSFENLGIDRLFTGRSFQYHFMAIISRLSDYIQNEYTVANENLRKVETIRKLKERYEALSKEVAAMEEALSRFNGIDAKLKDLFTWRERKEYYATIAEDFGLTIDDPESYLASTAV